MVGTEPLLRLRGAWYRYGAREGAQVGPLDLEVRAGERVLLVGPTGCGKSTLLRLAAGLAVRHGRGSWGGTVQVAARNGWEDPGEMSPSRRVSRVGWVTQEPHDQVITDRLDTEVAFGPLAAGVPRAQVQDRVAHLLAQMGLPPEGHRSPCHLSGGQVQRLVVAAALAAGAPLLLLDEPLAQLDPGGARDLLERLASRPDLGVLLAEHRVDTCLPYCTRVVEMDGGRLISDRPAEEWSSRRSVHPVAMGCPSAGGGAPLLAVRDLRYRYPGAREEVLKGVNLQVERGERVALLGVNGSGKSTLLAALAGSPGRNGRILDVPQNPDLSLFCDTVQAELAFGPREQRLGVGEVEDRVLGLARDLHLLDLLDRPPQGLSRGQRLRTAVAAALACAPEVLLLDEPTSGQDRERVDGLMEAVARRLAGGALVFATHDLDLALRHGTRAVWLEGGRIREEGAPDSVVAAFRRAQDP